MAKEVKDKHDQSLEAEETENGSTPESMQQTITLPWIPGVSTRLKKVYRKAGYKVVFKSGKSLGSILTSKNKMKLPKNSFPGNYTIPCSCGVPAYRGETKKKVLTRVKEHEEYIRKNQSEKSGVAYHSSICTGTIEFDKARTVAVQPNAFLRKVRETLEIQKYDCHYIKGGMNPDKGQYVTTKFWIPFMKYLKRSETDI